MKNEQKNRTSLFINEKNRTGLFPEPDLSLKTQLASVVGR